MKRYISRIAIILIVVALPIFSAGAANTRSTFDGYPVESSIMLDVVVDYSARTDGQPVYIGYRMPGVAESAVGWLIFKCIYDDSNNFLRKVAAGGENQFDKVWDNRASYTYDEN
jgi:hypothetical protein